MAATVEIAPTLTGDADETARIMDALEGEIDCERTTAGLRCEFPDAESLDAPVNKVIDALQRVAPGWQDHVNIEV